MTKTGDNIYRRKDGRWEGRFVKERRNGRTYFGYVFAGSYREIRAKLTKARCEWREGMLAAERNKNKLGVVSDLWLKESEAFLKESTTAKYRDYLYCYICPLFGKTDLQNITNEDLSKFCGELMRADERGGQGLSPKTAAEILRIMKQIRRFAMLRGINAGYTEDCVEIRQKPKPLRVFSPLERERLHAYLASSGKRSHLGILLCLSTGLRIGEICALTWNDISLEEQRLYVRRTLQRIRDYSQNRAKTKVVITAPKSMRSIRAIPLTEELCAAIAPTRLPGAYFLTGDSGKFMEPRTMQNHFKSVLKACSIRNANFHVLRHTFATQCIEAGFDAKCLSEVLGHSSVNITMNRYVHPSMDLKLRNMEKITRQS